MRRLLFWGFALLLVFTVNSNAATIRFAAPVTYPVDSGAASVAVGDLNGDGFPDIATANVYAGTISILLNNRDGKFTLVTNIPSLAGGPWSVIINDFNGDGLNDIAINGFYGGSSSGVAVLINDGSGVDFTQIKTATAAAFSMIDADVNSDGFPDLIAANYVPETVSITLNQHVALFGPPQVTRFPAYSYPFAVASADFNRDGLTDLVCVNNGAQTANFLFGKGDGNFALVATASLPDAPTFVATGDLDEDGNAEVVTIQWGSYSVLQLSSNGFIRARNHSLDCVEAMLADMDLDGHLDFVTLTGGGCGVLRGTGRGSFHRPQTFALPHAALDNLGKPTIAVDDLDRDGLPDVVVLNDDYTLSVLLNRTHAKQKFGHIIKKTKAFTH